MKCFYWLVPIIVKGKNYIRESDKVRSMEPLIQIDTQVVNQPVNLVLSGNAKRKQSCQRVGGEKKRVGHKREDDFKRQFHPASLTEVTEYGATSDTWLATPIADEKGISRQNVSNGFQKCYVHLGPPSPEA